MERNRSFYIEIIAVTNMMDSENLGYLKRNPDFKIPGIPKSNLNPNNAARLIFIKIRVLWQKFETK